MSDSLHTLITSMSKSEKRYFALYASITANKQEKTYLRLFQLMLKQKKYDEQALKALMGHRFFAQQKKHLQHKVLQALRAFHEDGEAENEISRLMQESALLATRNLLRDAEKKLLRAEELATLHEKFALRIQIQQAITGLLSGSGNPKKLKHHVQEFRKQLPLLVKQLDNQVIFEKDYLLFVMQNNETEFVRSPAELDRLKKSLQFSLLKHEKKTLSVSALLHFHYQNAMFYYLSGDIKKSLYHFSAQLNLFEQHPAMMSGKAEAFNKTRANLILLNNLNGHFNESKKLLYGLSQNIRVNGTEKIILQYRSIVLEINLLVKQRRMKEALSLFNRHESGLKETESQISLHLVNERHILLPDLCVAAFCTGETKKVMRVLNDYFNEHKGEVKTDAYILLRMLHILLYIKTGNDEPAAYALRSLERFLKERKRNFRFENMCIKNLHSLLKNTAVTERKKIYKNFTDELLPLKRDPFNKCVFYSADWEWLLKTHL